MCFCFLLLLTLFYVGVNGFNFDTEHPIVISDPVPFKGSYFGFAFAFKTNSTHKWLVIGAPRAENPPLSGLHNGLAYECFLDNHCNYISNILRESRTNEKTKTNTLFGATISSDPRPNGRFIVCDPGNKIRMDDFYQFKGTCFVYESSYDFWELKINKYLIKKSENDTLTFYYLFGQIGFSAAVDKNKIFLGAPGMNNWAGNILSISEKRDILEPNNFIELSEYDYFGYSLAIVKFREGNNLLAAGAPRGNFFTGMVLIIEEPKKIKEIREIRGFLYGETTGEYFGAALVALDIDGDGLDEIVVGAPNENRVEIFSFSSEHSRWDSIVRLNNSDRGGNFGISLASIGDLDGDGGMDMAIAAPYEDDGKGVVYIYRSQSQRVQMVSLSQIIRAPPGILSWGASFAPDAVDVDGNGVTDLAVGAYVSGKVVILRASPVAYIKVSLEGAPSMIVANSTEEFNVQACIRLIKCPDNIDLAFNFSIDNGMSSRAYLKGFSPSFENKTTYFWRINRQRMEKEHCDPLAITINQKTDFMLPLELELIGSIIDPDPDSNSFCSKCPLLDPMENTHKAFLSILFANGCAGMVCFPDLKIENKKKYEVLAGITELLSIEIKILNSREPAFGSKLYIYMPNEVKLFYVPSFCEEFPNNTLVECNIGNPILDNYLVELQLDTSKVPYDINEFTINVTAISKGNETTPDDNTSQLVVNVIRASQLKIYSSVFPGHVTLQNNSPNKIKVTHSFHVTNVGPIPVSGMVHFWIPEQIQQDLPAMVQVISVNSTGEIVCTSKGPSTSFKVDFFWPAPPDSPEALQFSCSTNSSIYSCSKVSCSFSESVLQPNSNLQINVFLLLSVERVQKVVDEFGFIRTIMQFDIQPDEKFSYVADTVLYQEKANSMKIVYIILAFLGGLIIFGALAIALYKMGFFDRKGLEERIMEKEIENNESNNSNEN